MNITQKRKNIKNSKIFTIYIVFLIIINILPYFKYRISYVPSAIFSLLPIVLVIRYSVQRRYVFKIIICSFGLGLMYFLVRYQFDIVSSINEFIRGVRFFVPALIFYYIVQRNDKKGAKIIFIAFVLVFSYVLIKTLVELQVNPIVARLLASGNNDDGLFLLRSNNIGGYGFSYAIGVLFPFLTDLAYSNKSIKIRLFSVAAVAFCSIYVVSAQYTFLFILSFISAFLVILLKSKNVVMKISLFFSSVLLLIGLGDFFELLSHIIKQDALAEKFSWLALFFSGKGDISVLHSRPKIYMDAFLSFLHSPIWGNIQSSGNNEYYTDNTHSTVLAIMRGTGIMGLMFYVIGIILTFNLISKGLIEKNKDIISLKVGFIYFFILSLLNPTHFVYEISYVLLLFVPLGIYLFGSTKIIFKGEKHDKASVEE